MKAGSTEKALLLDMSNFFTVDFQDILHSLKMYKRCTLFHSRKLHIALVSTDSLTSIYRKFMTYSYEEKNCHFLRFFLSIQKIICNWAERSEARKNFSFYLHNLRHFRTNDIFSSFLNLLGILGDFQNFRRF